MQCAVFVVHIVFDSLHICCCKSELVRIGTESLGAFFVLAFQGQNIAGLGLLLIALFVIISNCILGTILQILVTIFINYTYR